MFKTHDRPQEIVVDQAKSLWSAIRQKSVWLPAIFIFLWRATPSSDSAFFYFLTNDIGEDCNRNVGCALVIVASVRSVCWVATLSQQWSKLQCRRYDVLGSHTCDSVGRQVCLNYAPTPWLRCLSSHPCPSKLCSL